MQYRTNEHIHTCISTRVTTRVIAYPCGLMLPTHACPCHVPNEMHLPHHLHHRVRARNTQHTIQHRRIEEWVNVPRRAGTQMTTYRGRCECAYTMNHSGCGSVRPVRIFGTCVRICNDMTFGTCPDKHTL